MDEFELRLKLADGSNVVRLIRTSDEGNDPNPYSIELDDSRFEHAHFEGQDLFDCLEQLRRRLDLIDIKVLCNGARLNAVCSSMASQMGGCQKVYLVKLGQPTNMRDLVPIFGEAPAETIATVSEQDEFIHRWAASLRAM